MQEAHQSHVIARFDHGDVFFARVAHQPQRLIDSAVHRRDRRVVAVGITRAGRELVAAIEAPLADWLESRLGALGAAELERLSRLLERLRERPERSPG